MTREEMAAHMDTLHENEMFLREAGQKEYAHDEDNAFGNFERLAKDLNEDREFILWVYLAKHLDGIKSHLKGHRSQRESVQGRISDARVYLAILSGMIHESGVATIESRKESDG
jgi:hypothetical protein